MRGVERVEEERSNRLVVERSIAAVHGAARRMRDGGRTSSCITEGGGWIALSWASLPHTSSHVKCTQNTQPQNPYTRPQAIQ